MALPADDSCTLHVLKLTRFESAVIASFENDPILSQCNVVDNSGGVRLFYSTAAQVLPIMQHLERHGVVMIRTSGEQCVLFADDLRPWHIVTTHHHLCRIIGILLAAPRKYRCKISAGSEPVTVFVKNDA